MDNTTRPPESSIDFDEEFDRLVKLFRDDRFGFELERKRMIEQLIAATPDERNRENLLAIQENWDRVLRGAGSGHNRFVMSQTLLWDHIINVFLPTLQSCTLKTTVSKNTAQSTQSNLYQMTDNHEGKESKKE